jgi:hypothetical protein
MVGYDASNDGVSELEWFQPLDFDTQLVALFHQIDLAPQIVSDCG